MTQGYTERGMLLRNMFVYIQQCFQTEKAVLDDTHHIIEVLSPE